MLGAIIGDTVGSRYEFLNHKSKDFKFFTSESHLTDDSYMTLAVMEMMQNKLYTTGDDIIDSFITWGRMYPDCGYGASFAKWLSSNDPRPYNSYGNGAAMRVSPVGYYSHTLAECQRLAEKITIVSHNHPNGIKAAVVVSSIIFYLTIGKSKKFIKEYASGYYNLDFDYNDLVKSYEFDETAENTVPQAIYCFLISDSFIDAIRTAVSIGGDSDTLTCITGAMAEAYYKHIPRQVIDKLKGYIPPEVGRCNPSKVLTKYLTDKSITVEKLSEVDNDTFILKRVIKSKKTTELIYSKKLDILINYLYERIKELDGITINDLVELRGLKNSTIENINAKLLSLANKNIIGEDFYLYKNKQEYLKLV